MMTISKLKTLKNRTCIRKCAQIFHEQALLAMRKESVDFLYLKNVCSLFAEDMFTKILTQPQLQHLEKLKDNLFFEESTSLAFVLEDLHQSLLSVLGSEPSDWDFTDEKGELDRSQRIVLPHILILDRLRSPFNVGSLFRSADSFGIEEIWLVEGTADVHHPRCSKSARGCTRSVSYRMLAEEEVVKELKNRALPLFALELGGCNLSQFSFPAEGVAVIGSEEMGVSPTLLSLCDSSLGRVSIPLGGTKGSLNVSVASGIMLYSWYMQ